MTVEYDEIRITTRREIAICEQAIKKLEIVIAAMEKKYQLSSAAFQKDFDPGAPELNNELKHWYESCAALEQWRARLAEHMRIMEM
jgi:hypothetical protein